MSIEYYRGLLAQTARVEAFRRAIRATVRPGDCVLDLGTGLGTYAFFAAEAGAGRVVAVDHDPIVHVARAVADANELADRVTCLRGRIPDLALPAPADVLVFEDFPVRLFDARVFLLFRDLHGGVLAAGARTIPGRARVFLAPVSSDRLRALVEPFSSADRAFGLDWRASVEYIANRPLHVAIEPGDLALAPQAVRDITLTSPPPPDALDGVAEWTVSCDASLDGLAFWFDLELIPDDWLSNAPGARPCSWGHLFLPLASRLPVRAGATLRAHVTAPPDSSGAPGWLAWSLSSDGATARGNEFASVPASLTDMLIASPDGVPRLTRRGAIDATVLGLTDGRRSLREIAAVLRTTYPELSERDALQLAAETLRGRAAATGANGRRVS